MNFIRNLIGKVSSKVGAQVAPTSNGSATLAKQRLAAVILDQRAMRIAEQGGIPHKPQPAWANVQYPSTHHSHQHTGFAASAQTAATSEPVRAANSNNIHNSNAVSSKPVSQPPPAQSNAATPTPTQPTQVASTLPLSTGKLASSASSAKPTQQAVPFSVTPTSGSYDPTAIDTIYGVGPKIRQKLIASKIDTVQGLAALSDAQCEALKKEQQVATIFLLRSRAKERLDELRKTQ